MRFVRFTEVQMREINSKLEVRKMPRYIVAETVTSVIPAAMPSEITGPQGQPVMAPATYICVAGERILVDVSMNEAIYKLTWERVDVESPDEKTIHHGEYIMDDYIITEKISKPISNDEESSIIES